MKKIELSDKDIELIVRNYKFESGILIETSPDHNTYMRMDSDGIGTITFTIKRLVLEGDLAGHLLVAMWDDRSHNLVKLMHDPDKLNMYLTESFEYWKQ